MKTFTFTVHDENGIHARPAGQLVKLAKGIGSSSTLEFGGKSVDMRKLFAVMGLGVKHGDTVTINVDGPDEENDAAALESFFKDNF